VRVRVPTSWRENDKMNALRIPTATSLRACLLLIFALPLLSSCGCDPEVRVVTETQTVVEEVEVYKPLPETLTKPVPYPPSLPADFTVGDLLDLNLALYDALDAANADKARAGELTRQTAPSE
jgi:hypothetical protein